MKDVTVLLTCTGGVISPSHVFSLKNNPDGRSVRIIGVDTVVPCIGQYTTDKFYRVPFGTDPNYVDTLLEICEKESVDVVFPASHEEILSLSSNHEKFTRIGTKIAASKHSVLELSCNKKLAYEKLKEKGLPCPNFFVVKSFEEFEKAAYDLEIDQKKVVMKPLIGRGGRGTRILTKKSILNSMLTDKPGSLEVKFDVICQLLKEVKDECFPELILMECLSDPICSVDFLAKDGYASIIVPKLRISGNASQTLVGVVKRDAVIEEDVRRISEAFGFDYTINIEMGYNVDGVALPFDFNPRLAASVAFCSAAGANILYFALKMALGEEVPKVEVRDKVMMIRYFKEVYINPDAGFKDV